KDHKGVFMSAGLATYLVIFLLGSLMGYALFALRRRIVPRLLEQDAGGRDITARQRTDEALRDSEERFQALVENGSDLLVISDITGIIHYVSPPVRRVLGYEPNELIGRNSGDYIFPDDAEAMKVNFTRLLSAPGNVVSQEGRVRHRDGSWTQVE